MEHISDIDGVGIGYNCVISTVNKWFPDKAGLLFTGLGYGGTPTLSSAFIMKQFGPKYYPVNFSICNFSLIPAAIIGPMVSSWLIDKSNGAYTGSFVMMIVLAVLAAAAWVMVDKFAGGEKK